jgi:Major Facilitator Superfamily
MFGFSVSMFGSRLTTIAFPMVILSLTGSPVAAGVAILASTAPGILFYLPAGALVDRWNPRRTMLVSESGRGIAVLTIVVLLACQVSNVLLIVVVVMIEETLEIFAVLSERRYIGILPDEGLKSSALTRTEARTHVVSLAGRPFGALFFEFFPVLPFLADFLSFIVSVSILFRIKDEDRKYSPQPVWPGLIREIFAGIRFSRNDSFVRAANWLTAFMTLVSQAIIMIFIVDIQKLHLSMPVMGIVLASSGAGGVLGALMGSRVRVPDGFSRINFQVCIWTFGLLALSLSPVSWEFPIMGVVMLVFGFAGAMGNIEFDTHVLRKIPSDMLARVTSIDRLSSYIACAVGPATGGILVGKLGARPAMWVLFVLTLFVAGLVSIPHLWRLVAGNWRQMVADFDKKRLLDDAEGAAQAGCPPALGGEDAVISRAPVRAQS